MKKILFGLGFILPTLAFATTFPESGINFTASSIVITGPTGATCLGQSLPHTFSLEEMGISETTTTLSNFGDWNTPGKQCFQQAGNYTMQITLLDNAGNQTDISPETFVITSATPNQENSGFLVNCNNTVANASDTCSVNLQLQDKFNNEVEQTLPGIELSAPLTENPGDANLATKFRAGLRIGGSNFISSNPISFSWEKDTPFSTAISAIAPSIQRVETGISGTYLASVVNRTVDFQLDQIPEIATDGSVAHTYTNFTSIPMALRFDAPIAVVPGFEKERISFGDPIVMTSTLGRSGSTSSDSVTSLLKSVSSHRFLDPDAVPDANGALPEGTPLNETFVFAPVIDREMQSVKKIIFAENAFDEPKNISLITDASYSLHGNQVKYPAGAIGQPLVDAVENDGYSIENVVGFNTTGVDIRNIGVSIEGIVIGDYDQMYLVGGDKNKMTALSSLHSVDIREKIIKNAYQLIRNATDVKTDVNDFSWDLFDNQDVVVVDLSDKNLSEATLTLPAHTLPSGQKTLIVVNGNVLFTGNHEYADTSTDSFGLILLRDKAGPEPDRGNIFVHSDVQKLEGTLFADGSFFNGNTANVATANTGPRAKQLRLIGSLLARNTVGGSRRVGAGYFFTPWDTAELEKAKRYDLHEIRQFDYDDVDNRDDNCVKDGAACEKNIAAFIIRLDQKSTLLPPPGFLTD